MADGIMDSIGSVLTNPEVETLLPTILGAGGGLLSAPLGTGRRGAIGSALQGAGQGLAQGMRVAQAQPLDAARLQEAKAHLDQMKIQTTQAQNALNDQQQLRPVLDKAMAGLDTDEHKNAFQAMVLAGDPLGAIKYAQQFDPTTQRINYGIVNSSFPQIQQADYARMPPESQKKLFDSAIEIQKSGNMLHTYDDGHFLWRLEPKPGGGINVVPVLGPDNKQLPSKAATVANIHVDAAAAAREDKPISVVVNGKAMELPASQINALSSMPNMKVEFPSAAVAETHEAGTEGRFDVTSAKNFLKDNVESNKPGAGWTYEVKPDDTVHWDPPPGLSKTIGITKAEDKVIPGAYEAWKKTQGAATKGGGKTGGQLTPQMVADAEAKGYKFTGRTLPDGRLEITKPDGTKAAYRIGP